MFSFSLAPAWGLPGGGEILVILLIAVVLFGHKRIPQLGDALGKGIRNFKRAFSKDEDETSAPQALSQSSESQKTRPSELESPSSDSKDLPD